MCEFSPFARYADQKLLRCFCITQSMFSKDGHVEFLSFLYSQLQFNHV